MPRMCGHARIYGRTDDLTDIEDNTDLEDNTIKLKYITKGRK